jgi:hypothetical protein
MITGTNRVFQHAGRELHVQCEDLGGDEKCFEVRVFDGGAVLWRKKVSYAQVLEQGLPKAEQDEALNSLMEKTIVTVQAAIAKGKIAG